MQQPEKRYFTPHEYLELEEFAEYKSEYYQGEIFAMSGGTSNHNRIALDLASNLNIKLSNTKCEVFMNDLRVWIDSRDLFIYPDILVICNKLEYTWTAKTLLQIL